MSDALLEQAIDLEAQAFRIVLTGMIPGIEYIDVTEAQKKQVLAGFKNIRKYPGAIERLELSREKTRKELSLFERSKDNEESFVHWESIDWQNQELTGKD